MTWLIPIHAGKVLLGSDGIYACKYVRPDKKRELINFIANKSYRHEDITEIYEVSEAQFRVLDIFNVDVLRSTGRKVYE